MLALAGLTATETLDLLLSPGNAERQQLLVPNFKCRLPTSGFKTDENYADLACEDSIEDMDIDLQQTSGERRSSQAAQLLQLVMLQHVSDRRFSQTS